MVQTSSYHFAKDVVESNDAEPSNATVGAHNPHPIHPAHAIHPIPFGVTVGVDIKSPPFKSLFQNLINN